MTEAEGEHEIGGSSTPVAAEADWRDGDEARPWTPQRSVIRRYHKTTEGVEDGICAGAWEERGNRYRWAATQLFCSLALSLGNDPLK
jgi:hypothetical protein